MQGIIKESTSAEYNATFFPYSFGDSRRLSLFQQGRCSLVGCRLYAAAKCETHLPSLLVATVYLLVHLSRFKLPLHLDQSPGLSGPETESVVHDSANDKL